MSRFSLIALSPNLSFLPTTSKETPASHITNKAQFPYDLHDRCNRHHRPKMTIATILTIHGFHMIIAIVAIAAVLWLNASKQMMDILFSLLLLLIVSLPILSQSDRLLKLLVIFLCFTKTESHSNL